MCLHLLRPVGSDINVFCHELYISMFSRRGQYWYSFDIPFSSLWVQPVYTRYSGVQRSETTFLFSWMEVSDFCAPLYKLCKCRCLLHIIKLCYNKIKLKKKKAKSPSNGIMFISFSVLFNWWHNTNFTNTTLPVLWEIACIFLSVSAPNKC